MGGHVPGATGAFISIRREHRPGLGSRFGSGLWIWLGSGSGCVAWRPARRLANQRKGRTRQRSRMGFRLERAMSSLSPAPSARRNRRRRCEPRDRSIRPTPPRACWALQPHTVLSTPRHTEYHRPRQHVNNAVGGRCSPRTGIGSGLGLGEHVGPKSS